MNDVINLSSTYNNKWNVKKLNTKQNSETWNLNMNNDSSKNKNRWRKKLKNGEHWYIDFFHKSKTLTNFNKSFLFNMKSPHKLLKRHCSLTSLKVMKTFHNLRSMQRHNLTCRKIDKKQPIKWYNNKKNYKIAWKINLYL